MLRLLPLLFVATVALGRTSTDLDVGWISRHPEIDYVLHSANPRVEGWPRDGEIVTWRAHVRNWSSAARTTRFEWLLDHAVIASGTVTLPANSFSEVDLQRPWSFERHELTFRIDADATLAEESEANNELTIFTDALAVGFWVEQSVYDFMRENQQTLGIGSASFEDFAQRHIDHFNEMARLAVYPETPGGVLDRWRLQKIVVVPDHALPLVAVDPTKGSGSSHPNDDRTIDLSWGFTADLVPFFTDTTHVTPSNQFYIDKSVIHELGHARYLIDVYAFGVKHVPPKYRVEITEKGAPVAGTTMMPGATSTYNGVQGVSVHDPDDSGLMALDYDWIDRMSAAALNLIAGSRAVDGIANEPGNYAAFINDLPARNRITLRDRSGNPIPNAEVDLFQSVRAIDDESDAEAYVTRVVDDTPDLHFTSDSEGRIVTGRNPFTPREMLDGHKLGEMTAILRVRANGATSFGFLESRALNLAYWRGERDLADIDVLTGLYCPRQLASLSQPAYHATLSTNKITFSWQPVAGATSYTLWASIDRRPAIILADHTTQRSITESIGGSVEWWVESHFDTPCASERSLMYTFNAPPLPPHRRTARH